MLLSTASAAPLAGRPAAAVVASDSLTAPADGIAFACALGSNIQAFLPQTAEDRAAAENIVSDSHIVAAKAAEGLAQLAANVIVEAPAPDAS